MRNPFGQLRKLAIACLAIAIAPVALADSVDPATYSDSLAVGESVTIAKTVTISAGKPTSALLDVMFLMDTTGSMGGEIADAKASALTILSDLASFGDLASGTAYFNDSTSSSAPISNFTAITSALSTADANTVTGINGYAAGTPSSGGDFPEEGFLGITRTVDDTAWRPGSNRFLIMFGDATDGGDSPFAGDSFAEASAALAGKNVSLIGISYSGSFSSEYTAIATGSGGSMNNGSVAGAVLADLIKSAVTAAFGDYENVCLDPSSAPAGVAVSVSACINGTFDRSIERTFDFDVTFTGVSPGDYSFPIFATVDGGNVATEMDRIIVGGAVTTNVPEPNMLATLGLGLLALLVVTRRRKQVKLI